MNEFIVLHIIAASITLLSAVKIWIRPIELMTKIFYVGTFLSLLTGAILPFVLEFNLKTFCLKIGLYLLVLVVTYFKLNNTQKAKSLLISSTFNV